MSVDIMSRIWCRDDLTSMEKLVGLALADAASDEGVAWPAVDTVAAKSSVSRRTVQNAITSLEGKQLLRVVHRVNRSSYYVFNIDNLPLVRRERAMKEAGPAELTGASAAPVLDLGVQVMHPTGARRSATGAGGAPRNVREPSEETDPPSPDGEGTPAGEDLFGGGLPVVAEPPLEQLVEERWHELKRDVPYITDIEVLSDDRVRKIHSRGAVGKKLGLTPWQTWQRVMDAIPRSAFLCGRRPPDRSHSSPFKLDLEYVLRPAQFVKILEGSYDDRPGSSPSTHDPDGRRFGPSEQAGRSALERSRARRAQSGQQGHPRGSAGSDHRRLPAPAR